MIDKPSINGDIGDSITIGVSACLLGEKVRYDGRHKRDSCIYDAFDRFFRIIPVCPEAECGMPVPREAMQLEGDPAAPRLMTIRGRADMTEQMLAFCAKKVRELEKLELCGFIFKKRSPSCEPYRIELFNDGLSAGHANGLFAAAVIRHFPGLPVEEEERLREHAIREAFITRIFEYRDRKNAPSKNPPENLTEPTNNCM